MRTRTSPRIAGGRAVAAAACCWVIAAVALASAQAPERNARRGPRIDMQVVADSLGVQCDYCHAEGQVTATGRPRLEVARNMIDMTLDLNARVQLATGKGAAEAVRIDCATCHRGVPIPKPLQDLVLESVLREGHEPAAQLYRDLRAKYYGSQSYDFSEGTLLAVADRLAQTRPESAVAMANLNLEFHPTSWRSYLARGIAQSRRMNTTPDAVESFKKALELDPGNGVVQGWLAQTEPLARRVRP